MKVTNRNLKERLHELSKDYKPPIKNADTPIKNVDTNSLSQEEMKNHCKQLMQTVGKSSVVKIVKTFSLMTWSKLAKKISEHWQRVLFRSVSFFSNL